MLLSEKKILAVCVILAIAGIAALFVIAAVAEPVQKTISEAAQLKDSGGSNSEKVKVRGFVDSVSITESRAVVKIAELETVEAVSFDASYIKGLGLKRFQEVEVFGELRQYKGRASIIVAEVRVLNGNKGSSTPQFRQGRNAQSGESRFAPLSTLTSCGCGEEFGKPD